MNKKQLLIKKIENFDTQYFNEDQKNIAIEILKKVAEEECQNYYDFICSKRKTGFSFDYSPEVSLGRIITLKEDKKRRINVKDEIKKDENKLIIGDNYNALKSLLITHKNRIDIIYIDPPYNTEQAKVDGNQSSKEKVTSKFIYKDKFGRGGWLNMMKSRLTLAKDLLSENGTIFVSIDDNQQSYLKVLMDDIFGEEKFVSSVPRYITSGGKNNGKMLAKEHDYIIIYSNLSSFLGLEVSENTFNKDDNDGFGKYQLRDLMAAPGAFERKGSQTKTIKFNNKFFDPITKEGKKWYWRWGEERVALGIKLNIIVEKNGKLFSKLYLDYDFKQGDKELVKKTRTKLVSSRSWDNSLYSNGNGSEDIKKLGINFSFPKPVELIKSLINLIDHKNLILLDFFAGSGTSGEAILKLNEKDAGNRKFILCTNNENNIAIDVTFERLYRVIRGCSTQNKSNFKYEKPNKIYDTVKLRVININDDVKISLEDNVDDSIYLDCLKGLKLLDSQYNKKDINLYYDLSSLNPLKDKEDKF